MDEKRRMNSPMSDADKREQWGDDFADHEDELLGEVEARWGDTSAYEESARNVSRYTKEDWATINDRHQALEARIRELIDAGADPAGDAAMDVAEAQRAHISKWFYEMDHHSHVRKSELYVEDPRYRNGIEQNTRPGAADWLRAAIIANENRASLDHNSQES